MKASIKTAPPRPMPNSAMTRSPPKEKDEKTQIMTSAAAEMTRPVLAWPRLIASALLPVFSHSSCMRETRNTW